MTTPPRYFLRFFRWFCHPDLERYIEGDLVELYTQGLKDSGVSNANWRFRWEVLKLMRPGIIRPIKGFSTTNNIIMYSSYFKIAWRNLLKNKAYSSINIVGLAAGMTVAILIGLWIADELSFDSYFKNHERLAEVMVNQSLEGQFYTGASIAPPVADPLRTQFAGEFKALSLATFSNDYVIANGENKISAKGMWVQKEFPVMFTLDMISGRQDALKDPSTILISQSMARSLFGDNDPLNKAVHIDKTDMTVGGVFDDLPDNTTFAGTGLLLSWDNPENGTNRVTDWSNHTCQLFVQLADHAVAAEVTEKVKSLPTPHITGWHEEVLVHPMDQLHLYGKFTNGKVDGGRIKFVWLFGIIGGFVLLLACINFMNLSTARSEKRAKEVGIRKSIGSIRGQLIGQFLSESMVMVGLAFVLSLVLAQLSLPFFNMMADKRTTMPWTEPAFWLLSLGFTFFTGMVSGSYPAFYLSAFQPIQALKGALKTGRFASLPRKVLVVLQFTVSITLIIGTIVVFNQIQYAKNRLPGYAREGLITVKMNTPGLRDHYEALRNDLMQSEAAENVSRASQSPSNFNNNNGLDWRGKDPGLVVFFRNVNVTSEFGKTIGWTIKEGRDFSEEFRGDSASIILSEEALRITGLQNPIGEVVTFHGNNYTIVGIVKDMVTQSPYEPMAPSMFFASGWLNYMVIKLNPALPIQESLAAMTPIFAKHNPEGPFEFSFVDETFAKKFANEERVGNLAGVFAVLAILISCLGLFGLSSFVAEQRTKEIGIRKVLGASVTSLWQMLSKDFVLLILIACAISIPLSIWFMGDWLLQFDYRTTITWTVFAIACLGALIITLLTVSFQAIKAAVANPVNSLKTE